MFFSKLFCKSCIGHLKNKNFRILQISLKIFDVSLLSCKAVILAGLAPNIWKEMFSKLGLAWSGLHVLVFFDKDFE